MFSSSKNMPLNFTKYWLAFTPDPRYWVMITQNVILSNTQQGKIRNKNFNPGLALISLLETDSWALSIQD